MRTNVSFKFYIFPLISSFGMCYCLHYPINVVWVRFVLDMLQGNWNRNVSFSYVFVKNCFVIIAYTFVNMYFMRILPVV